MIFSNDKIMDKYIQAKEVESKNFLLMMINAFNSANGINDWKSLQKANGWVGINGITGEATYSKLDWNSK